MLNITNLNQFYGGSHTLWDLTLSVPKGSCTCLMGRNGMGKTTLLRCIMGLLPLATGEMIFAGEDLRPMPVHTRARLGIGFVPQGREIFSQLTVEENLKIGLPVRRDRKKVVPEHIYDMFPVLKKMLHRRGGDLSGGQQQQLAIGRALVIEPTMLILDEPTEGIQPNIVHEIGDVIINLRKAGLTVLLVEQNANQALRLAHRGYVLVNGAITMAGTGQELLARPEIRAAYLEGGH